MSDEQKKKISAANKGKPGWNKGLRGIESKESIRNRAEKMMGSKHPKWSGGKLITEEGYILVRRRNHPNANANGRVYEHRLVMEEIIGRPLLKNEVIHHINGDRADNRPENLRLFSEPGKHSRLHYQLRKRVIMRGRLSTGD